MSKSNRIQEKPGGWNVLGNDEMVTILKRHDLFSNVVSTHPAVPNGMDPPEHTAYRRIVEKYFEPPHIEEFEAGCRALAESRWGSLERGRSLEIMESFAHPYALDTQCAFVGWPVSMREPLSRWLGANQQATREQNRERLVELAAEFQTMVEEQMKLRRLRDPKLQGTDVTTRLMSESIDGRTLNSNEITSILRNWTVGELATMAASAGILAGFLAQDPSLQSHLRGNPEEIPYAVEEILRIHAPLWSNRRVVARDVDLGGHVLNKGDRLTLLWAEANRDERVFPNPCTFLAGRDHSRNLLYGAGIHVCPGAPLARLELRVAVETMLGTTTRLSLAETAGVTAKPPASGWEKLWIRLE